ncbi:MAG: hypothetical protein CM15mP128_2350 [Methanobacteriota archaeon]|nr:MAG: hypothetical protein CM15mP128_2350 [Euryarchaeota archaeon]
MRRLTTSALDPVVVPGFGGSNNCGIYGLVSPDIPILGRPRTAEGTRRGTSGTDIDEDNDGYNPTDQGDGIVDASSDGSQWDDSDGDGYGITLHLPRSPMLANTAGTSNMDRFGCLDTDGDGYSDPDAGWTILDGADVWPWNPEQGPTRGPRMATGTTTSTTSTRPTSCTSTSAATPSRWTHSSGTTRTVTATATTTTTRPDRQPRAVLAR